MTVQRIDLLELDIDLRIHDLWTEMWDNFPRLSADDEIRQEVAAFMRAAYGKGYMDALKDRGELCVTHGYRLPPPA